jgi:endoglucanase
MADTWCLFYSSLERAVPPSSGLTGGFNSTYLSGLTTIVNYITNKGAYVLIEPHNYMRYSEQTVFVLLYARDG